MPHLVNTVLPCVGGEAAMLSCRYWVSATSGCSRNDGSRHHDGAVEIPFVYTSRLVSASSVVSLRANVFSLVAWATAIASCCGCISTISRIVEYLNGAVPRVLVSQNG